MAKQDVLDAINATIVPNGAKAISAQALNNVLTMMTENAGEGGGSGDGALRVMVPDYASARDLFIPEGGFNSEIIELFRTEVEGSGMDFEPLFAAWETVLSHNAEVYQQLLAKTKANEGTMVVIDQSLPYSIMMKIMFNQQVPGAIEEMYFSSGQLGIFMGTYGKMSGEEVENMGIIPLSMPEIDAGDACYPSSITMLLQPDGSIVFEEDQPSASEVVTFYWPSDGENLTPDQKSKNARGVATLVKASLGQYTPPVSICTQISSGIIQYQTPLLYVVTSEGIEIHLTAFNVSSGAFEENVFGISTDGSILKA